MTEGSTTRIRALTERGGFWEALVALVAIAIYARTVGFGWVYDDQMEIVRNTFVHSLRHLPDLFTTTVWAGSGMETYLYRPLTLISYSVNHAVSGIAPWSYHLVNVLLHAGVTLLVYRVGRLWTLSAAAAGLGALLFAIHPVHVEAVAAVFGRRDLLAALFTLAMVLAHRVALARGGVSRLAFPMVAFAFAMLSKEAGVVGLVLVAAQDWALEATPRRLFSDRRAVGLYFGYVLLLLGYLLARTAVTGGMGVPETSVFDNPLVNEPLGTRLMTALAVVGRGFALLVAPITLSPDYSFDAIPLVRSITDWRLLATVIGCGALTMALTRGAVRRSAGPLAAAWYVIALLPTANLLVATGTIFGERLLYLPSVAFCLLAGTGITWLGRRSTPSATIVATLAVVGYATQTVRYSAAWDNDIALFSWAVEAVPRSTKAHHKLGEDLARAGEYGDAARSLRRALEIAPDNTYAAVTERQLRQRLAELYLPSRLSEEVQVAAPEDPDLLYLLGVISRDRADVQAAERHWLDGLARDSTHAETLTELGVLALTTGDTTAAIGRFERAVASKSSLASAWFNLGRLRLARGDRAGGLEALGMFLEAAGTRYPQQVEWARGVAEGRRP